MLSKRRKNRRIKNFIIKKKTSFRIDEQNIVDIQFLPGHQKPTFIVLHPVKKIFSENFFFRKIDFLAYK